MYEIIEKYKIQKKWIQTGKPVLLHLLRDVTQINTSTILQQLGIIRKKDTTQRLVTTNSAAAWESIINTRTASKSIR